MARSSPPRPGPGGVQPGLQGKPTTPQTSPLNFQSRDAFDSAPVKKGPSLDDVGRGHAVGNRGGNPTIDGVDGAKVVTGVDPKTKKVLIRNPWGWDRGEIRVPFNKFQKAFQQVSTNPLN